MVGSVGVVYVEECFGVIGDCVSVVFGCGECLGVGCCVCFGCVVCYFFFVCDGEFLVVVVDGVGFGGVEDGGWFVGVDCYGDVLS